MRSIILIVLSCIFLSTVESVTITSIDLGSEWMKIAVVAPGIPMEIALNKESKRKTPVSVAFRDGERTFGDDAITAGIKKPSVSYSYLLDLLGKDVSNPVVEDYIKKFPYYAIEGDPHRNTVLFRHNSNTTFSVEELCAQVLNYARELAAAYTRHAVKDVVITVPPFFNQAERRAILYSAELANLKVLSLMDTNAAVALNYGMFRRKEVTETAQNILFYDMGASFTVATIAAYQTVKTKERGFTETNPQVSILGTGYDRTLGGLEMQLRLRDFLAKKFNEQKKTKTDAFSSPRAMAKLMKAASKAKHVLSANTEHLVQVEGVLDDQDFSLKISRDEFENMCSDLFERVQDPVNAALISAGIDIKDVHQFIIVGGNTRIPSIQFKLQDIWGKELGKNINADEAAALGAVYRAADLGQGFKVMKFHVKESVIFPVDVEFERQLGNEDGSAGGIKAVKRSLFAKANSFPQKKVMTFNKHTSDFGFTNNYGDLSHLSKKQIGEFGRKNISFVMVSGVNEVFAKHIGEGAESKGIKAHFQLDESGLLKINSIEAVFDKNKTVEEEKPEESKLSILGSTLSKLFSGGDDAKSNDTSGNGTETNDSAANATADDNKDKSKKEQTKLVTIKEELQFRTNYLDIPSATEEQTMESHKKLNGINDMEKQRKDKEKARNSLESYIIDINVKFSQDDYQKASTQELRDEITAKAKEYDDWLYEDGLDQQPSVYKQRIETLEMLFEPIKNRVKEHKERPEALKALNNMMNMSSKVLHTNLELPESEKMFTDVELKTLDEHIINTQKWLENMEEKQEKLSLSEPPALSLYSIAEKMAIIERELKYLATKEKLARDKKMKEAIEAKIKAEKEAKENATKVNETIVDGDQINDTKSENKSDKEDSRKEPVLPEEEEVVPKEETKDSHPDNEVHEEM